jgi:DNA-binding transcriptional regulator PaaX
MGKLRMTIRVLLEFLDEMGEIPFQYSKSAVWRNLYYEKSRRLEHYYDSEIEGTTKRLLRKGMAIMSEKNGHKVVVISEKGKRQILDYDLEKFSESVEKWDGKWRVVFFDVEEERRGRRDRLRKYLQKLGMKQMQRSVWVCPFDCENQIKYLREVLEIPHDIKMGVMEKLENDEDLKKWFGL